MRKHREPPRRFCTIYDYDANLPDQLEYANCISEEILTQCCINSQTVETVALLSLNDSHALKSNAPSFKKVPHFASAQNFPPQIGVPLRPDENGV